MRPAVAGDLAVELEVEDYLAAGSMAVSQAAWLVVRREGWSAEFQEEQSSRIADWVRLSPVFLHTLPARERIAIAQHVSRSILLGGAMGIGAGGIESTGREQHVESELSPSQEKYATSG
jgi:hypothetical protein